MRAWVRVWRGQETVTSATLREMGLEAYLKTSGEEASGTTAVRPRIMRREPTAAPALKRRCHREDRS